MNATTESNGAVPAIVKRLRDDPKMFDQIKTAVPTGVDPRQWMRVLETSIMNDAKLMKATPASLMREAVQLAQVGLTTDRHLGEAYLFADSKGNCQARVDYKGFIKLGRQSGQFTQIYAESICANDPLQRLRAGDAKGIEHELALANRGDRLGYYAFVKFNDGTVDYEWMEMNDIYAVRDRYSQAYKSGMDNPWNPGPSEGEMCKKTVLHRLLKRLPKSPQLERAMSLENRAEFGMKDVTPEAAQKQTPSVNLADFGARPADGGRRTETEIVGDQVIDDHPVEEDQSEDQAESTAAGPGVIEGKATVVQEPEPEPTTTQQTAQATTAKPPQAKKPAGRPPVFVMPGGDKVAGVDKAMARVALMIGECANLANFRVLVDELNDFGLKLQAREENAALDNLNGLIDGKFAYFDTVAKQADPVEPQAPTKAAPIGQLDLGGGIDPDDLGE